MRIPPLEVFLAWPTPNYVDPVTRGPALIIINVIFMVLMTLAVILRFYSRYTCKRWLGWDDFFIGIALIFSLALGAMVIHANIRHGWDRHLWDLRFTQYQNASIYAFVGRLGFVLAATFTRLSLVCFLLRLVTGSGHTSFAWVLRAALLWQVVVCTALVFMTVFLCVPVRAYWAIPLVDNAKCLNEGDVTLAGGVVNCVSDLMVTLLPIPIVMKLNMPLRQRIGVIVLLSLGIVVTIAGIVRTYFIWKSLIESYDITWYSYQLWISATVEVDLAVLCACAPALKPLFNRLMTATTTYYSSIKNTNPSPEPSPTPTSSFFHGTPHIRSPRTFLHPKSTYSSSHKSITDSTTTYFNPGTGLLTRTPSHGSSQQAIWPERPKRNQGGGKRKSWFGLRSQISAGDSHNEDEEDEPVLSRRGNGDIEMQRAEKMMRQGIECTKTVDVSVSPR